MWRDGHLKQIGWFREKRISKIFREKGFTNKEYPEFPSTYCIKGVEKQKEVGIFRKIFYKIQPYQEWIKGLDNGPLLFCNQSERFVRLKISGMREAA